MADIEIKGIEIKEALIGRNTDGFDTIVARLGLEPRDGEQRIGMDAIVQWTVGYYVPATDGSPLQGMLGEGYEFLPTNLSEIPAWRKLVREESDNT